MREIHTPRCTIAFAASRHYAACETTRYWSKQSKCTTNGGAPCAVNLGTARRNEKTTSCPNVPATYDTTAKTTTCTNKRNRRSVNVQLERAAYQYHRTIYYMQIGEMNIPCVHCNTMKFRTETPGLCCASGMVKLSPLPDPTETLRALLYNDTPQSHLSVQY